MQPHQGKIRAWTLPTILGLAMGVVGSIGVVELRPQITVLPQCALKSGPPFSIPFRISNTGYFAFTVVAAHCYIRKFSGMVIDSSTMLLDYMDPITVEDTTWDNRHLGHAEGQTLSCEIEGERIRLTETDITVVIDYKATMYPASRAYFRFIGSGENWQWSALPSQDIQKLADKSVEEAIEQRKQK